MASEPKRARQSDTVAAAGAALSGCAAADVTLPCFAALPLPVVLIIFALLPADARARAAAVCQAWRHVLVGGPIAWRLWTELDLSGSSGVTCTRGDAALEGAAALARGRLRTLTLTDFKVVEEPHTFSEAALLRVLTANARLEDLTHEIEGERAGPLTEEQVQALLAAAPALQQLAVSVITETAAAARAMLRREPPYGALRPQQLLVVEYYNDASPLLTADGVISFAADVAACESLWGLGLSYATLTSPAALTALVDAALSRSLVVLQLLECTFTPAAALPQLARLLTDSRSMVDHLEIKDSPTLFRDVQEADMQALFHALAQRNRLELLTLKRVGLRAREKVLMRVLLRGALASRPEDCPQALVAVD